MTRQNYILVGILGLIIGLLVYLFLVNFELVDEEITTGYSKRALTNNFLAAERFLKKMDYQVDAHKKHDSLDKLLDSNYPGTIIMSYNTQLEARNRFDKLMAWMKRGGHLILEINSSIYPKEGEAKVGLLKFFNLSLDSKNTLFEDTSDETIPVQIYRDGEEFNTHFITGFSFNVGNTEYTVKADGANGTHLLEYNVGDGSITFLSDYNFWFNRNIAENDHAALLVEILGKNAGTVNFISTISMPSLLELIWKNGKWFCVSLLLLIAFYLWSLFEKFGPAIATLDTSRRSLIEHLDAAAKFDWRHFRGATLLASARRDLQQYLDHKHPSLARKSDDEIREWLSEKTEIAGEDIAMALDGDCDSATKLLQAIQTIQKIRKQL